MKKLTLILLPFLFLSCAQNTTVNSDASRGPASVNDSKDSKAKSKKFKSSYSSEVNSAWDDIENSASGRY